MQFSIRYSKSKNNLFNLRTVGLFVKVFIMNINLYMACLLLSFLQKEYRKERWFILEYFYFFVSINIMYKIINTFSYIEEILILQEFLHKSFEIPSNLNFCPYAVGHSFSSLFSQQNIRYNKYCLFPAIAHNINNIYTFMCMLCTVYTFSCTYKII